MKRNLVRPAWLLAAGALTLGLAGCGAGQGATEKSRGMQPTGSMELRYADQFAVTYYEGGYSLITVADGLQYLTIPEGAGIPDRSDYPSEAGEDVTLLQLPISNIYLAASSAMDLFRELDALESVKMTGTAAADWSLPEIRTLVEDGEIAYGGKYSAPDYEAILETGCDLAIESTMIYHTPEVKEQLELMDVPVFVERSSYESHPLGRAEWIRLYGLLSCKEEEAAAFMEDCARRLAEVETAAPEGDRPTVAFFYISSNGQANIRKPGDYISRMIGMAGGDYIFAGPVEEDNALSTMNLDMETFYQTAVDADILIYNSTVGTELTTLQELLDISPLFADFKAVAEGRVWCTGQNLYQETTGAAAMVEDFLTVFTCGEEQPEGLTYLHKLE